MAHDRDDQYRGSRGSRPQEPYQGRGDDRYGRDAHEDRGFFDRAADEVRSWFSDDDDRERDRREREDWGRETRWSGDRGSFGGGWGNQRPRRSEESRFDRDDDRNRDRGQYGDDQDRRPRGGTELGYGAQSFGSGSQAGGSAGGGSMGGGLGRDDNFSGPRFDRADVGSTGSHGVHPVSSPSGGAYGAGYGVSGSGFTSSARRYAMLDRDGDRNQERDRGQRRFGGEHDRHYSEWRDRQMSEIDRDYDEFRRENQSRFDQEFTSWRQRRGEQRQSMGRVREHMEVVGSDGTHIGKVDRVEDERIILTKNDQNAGGIHHSIPCAWIDDVDDKVRVNKTADEAMHAWRDEDRSRALFEREDRGSSGPHMLNRSFSNTYSGRDDS